MADAKLSLLFGIMAATAACDRATPPAPMAIAPTAALAPSASASIATPAPHRSAAAAAAPFVRAQPDNPQGVDACAFLGFSGFACRDALVAEKDAVVRRAMRRMSDADARQAFDALAHGEVNGVAHAEVASFCKESGPCGGTLNGGKADDGYACLTKAEAARQQKDLAASKRAHARACRCDPAGAQIPVMGGFLACDGPDKPVERHDLTTADAADVRACAACDPEKGPAACAREIARFSTADAEIARYLEQVHVPRCQKP